MATGKRLRNFSGTRISFSTQVARIRIRTRNMRILARSTRSPSRPMGSPRSPSASDDKANFKLWDVADGQLLRTFTAHSDLVHSVAFSPDGLTALDRQLGRRGELQTVGGRDRRGAPHSQGHMGLLFGRVLARWPHRPVRQSQRQGHPGDVATGKELRTFRGHSSGVDTVAFSPDGRTALPGRQPNPWAAPMQSSCGRWRPARSSAPSGGIQGPSTRSRFRPTAAPRYPAVPME